MERVEREYSDSLKEEDDDVVFLQGSTNENTIGASPTAEALSKVSAKFEHLSKSMLVEIASSQEFVIRRLERELAEERKTAKEEMQNVEEQLQVALMEMALLKENKNWENKNDWVNETKKPGCSGRSNLNRVLNMRVTTTKSAGTQCDISQRDEWSRLGGGIIPRTPEWNDGNRSTPGNSLKQPLVAHVLDCWSAATGVCKDEASTFHVPEQKKAPENTDRLEAFLLGSVGAAHGKVSLEKARDMQDARHYLEKWLLSVFTEGTRANPALLKVLELNNLPRDLHDGFNVHLLPVVKLYLNDRVSIFSRRRYVHDLKLVVKPPKVPRGVPVLTLGEEVELTPPQRKCILCHDLYYFPITKDAVVPDSWHTFNQLRSYHCCKRCLDIQTNYPANQWSKIYNEHLEKQRRLKYNTRPSLQARTAVKKRGVAIQPGMAKLNTTGGGISDLLAGLTT